MTEITRAAARAIIIGSAVSAPAAGVAFIRDWEAKKFRAFCERSDDDGFREAMTRMTFEEFKQKLTKRCDTLNFRDLAKDVEPFLIDPSQKERVTEPSPYWRKIFLQREI